MKLKISWLLLLTTALSGCHTNHPVQNCANASSNTKASVAPIEQTTPQPVENATTVIPDVTKTTIMVDPAANPAKQPAVVAKVIRTPEPQVMPNISKETQAPVIEIWQPNEAQIARGGELILGLKTEIKREPTKHEMQKRLQTHMGLSATQAEKIITALQQLPDQD